MTKNVLLLGASGFIGKAVLQELLDDENLHVTALQHHTPVNINHPRLTLLHTSLKRLTKDYPDLSPDVVVHAARYRTGKFGSAGRRFMALKGRKANTRILDHLVKRNRQVHIIYISGSLMYGSNPDKLITEDFPVSPVSFAREYVDAERPFLKAMDEGRHITMLRVPWVIGCGSWFRWNYLDVITRMGYVPQYGEGDAIMTFLDVRDLARSVKKLLYKNVTGVLNLYNPEYLTGKAWSQLLAEETGKQVHKLDSEKLAPVIREAFTADIRLGSNKDVMQEYLLQDRRQIRETLRELLPVLVKQELSGSWLTEHK